MSSPQGPRGAPSDPHCLDLGETLARVKGFPARHRMSQLLHDAGCAFHGSGRRLVAGPSARIVAIGGLPIGSLAARGVPPEEAAWMTRQGMGALGSMSYLSMPGDGPGEAYGEIAVGHGHLSVAHGASASILLAGVTTACEVEWACQRDLVHLARVTVARTSVQSAPPVVVPHPALADAFATLLAACDAARAEIEALAPGTGLPARDALEAMNLAYPAAKATAFVVTGSLRDLGKVLAAETDPGKEREFRASLATVRRPLAAFWPELFPAPAPAHADVPVEPSAPSP